MDHPPDPALPPCVEATSSPLRHRGSLLRRLVAGLLALGLVVGVGACSDDEDDEGTETDDTTEDTGTEDTGLTDDTGFTDDTATEDTGMTEDTATEETTP